MRWLETQLVHSWSVIRQKLCRILSIWNFVRRYIRLCFCALYIFYFHGNKLFFCLWLFFLLLFKKVVILVDFFPRRRKTSEITVLILRDVVLSFICACQEFVSFILQVNDVGLNHETPKYFTGPCFFLLAARNKQLFNTCGVSMNLTTLFRSAVTFLIKVWFVNVFYRYHRWFIRQFRLVWNKVEVYTFFATFLNLSSDQIKYFIRYFIMLSYFLLHFWNFIFIYRSVDIAVMVQVDTEHIDRCWFL